MNKVPDPEQLRLVEQPQDPPDGPGRPGKPKGRKTNSLFLKGPIPWPWLTQAMRLKGVALHVSVYLWWQFGMTKSKKNIKLSASKLAKLSDVDRATVGRALEALERAGLVKATRHQGRAARVTILDAPEEPRPTGGLIACRTQSRSRPNSPR